MMQSSLQPSLGMKMVQEVLINTVQMVKINSFGEYMKGFTKRMKSVVGLPHSMLDCNCSHSMEDPHIPGNTYIYF